MTDVKKKYSPEQLDRVVTGWLDMSKRKSIFVNKIRQLWPIRNVPDGPFHGQWTDASTQLIVDTSKKTNNGGVVIFTAKFYPIKKFEMRAKLYSKLKAAYLSQQVGTESWRAGKTEEIVDQRRDLQKQRMHTRMLAVFLRYETLIEVSKAAGMQGSVPTGAFHVLRDHFGVSGECFASPLNQTLVYLDTQNRNREERRARSISKMEDGYSFCSAFRDTDHWFGSRGSFFSSSFVLCRHPERGDSSLGPSPSWRLRR